MYTLKNHTASRALLAVAAFAFPGFCYAADSHGSDADKKAGSHHSKAASPTSGGHGHDGKKAESAHGHSSSHSVHGLTDHHAGVRFDSIGQKWKTLLKEGKRLEQIGKDDMYEAILYKLKGPPYSDPQRKDIYPLLIDFYKKRNIRVKLVEVYEEFAEKYPNDPELPEIFFRLGRLYKEFGAFELAQDRFYKVLSTTIRGARTDEEQVEFRQKSLAAQIEVADLFLELGNYERASQFFDRLLRLEDLDKPGSTENRAKVEFKRAYATYYNAKDLDNKAARNLEFGKVAKYLQNAGSKSIAYYDAYPDNEHAAESHFLLASIYKLMGTQANQAKAHDEVLKLIDKANRGVKAKTAKVMEIDKKPSIYNWNGEAGRWEDPDGNEANIAATQEINRQIDSWVHWQKKAGNMLANEHFEEGGEVYTMKAIEIYQKMIGLDPTPKWQAPIVYQLGLCFERLGKDQYNPKAIEAYEILTNPSKNPEAWGDWTLKIQASLEKLEGNENIDDSLADVLQSQEQFIFRMAEWRLKNLRWNLAAFGEVKRLEN